MTYTKIHERISTAARLASYGDTWPVSYAADVRELLHAVEDDQPLGGERVTTIRSRVIDARGAFPWPGGRWAGWYADDATALLEDLPVAV